MENTPLILDLLGWLAERPRAYDEVMDAWRSTCPRLTIWEDATDAGLVRVRAGNGGSTVEVTARGRSFLETHRMARGGDGRGDPR